MWKRVLLLLAIALALASTPAKAQYHVNQIAIDSEAVVVNVVNYTKDSIDIFVKFDDGLYEHVGVAVPNEPSLFSITGKAAGNAVTYQIAYWNPYMDEPEESQVFGRHPGSGRPAGTRVELRDTSKPPPVKT